MSEQNCPICFCGETFHRTIKTVDRSEIIGVLCLKCARWCDLIQGTYKTQEIEIESGFPKDTIQ